MDHPVATLVRLTLASGPIFRHIDATINIVVTHAHGSGGVRVFSVVLFVCLSVHQRL